MIHCPADGPGSGCCGQEVWPADRRWLDYLGWRQSSGGRQPNEGSYVSRRAPDVGQRTIGTLEDWTGELCAGLGIDPEDVSRRRC
jgi:hypothetical protein